MVANLFIIGASKCGSTYLHDLLGMHPDIYMSEVKEPCFFHKEKKSEGYNHYNDLFKEAKGEKYIGESSPLYSETTFFLGTPRRIYNYSPKAKIIYIVREPFSRLKSVYKQTIYSGHDKKLRYYDRLMSSDFNDAISNYPPYLEATKYKTHLDNYLQYFNKESVKVILFEELISNPKDVLSDVFSFLGVDEFSVDTNLAKKNESKNKKGYSVQSHYMRKLIPSSFINALPNSSLNIIKSTISWFLNKKIIEPKFNEDSEELIRNELCYEVKGIYEYLNEPSK